tara:strand:- start:285 stop:1514 length:1230 start_codon:yes stop_codon:yes gene_type:complete
MSLTNPQQTIFDDESRFKCISAGRRFGKTYLSMYEIARAARFPDQRIFYIAPTFRMGKQIIWKQLCDEMRQRRWVKKINESDLTLTLINKSTISVRSADNFDAMRGVSLDFCVLDEVAFMKKEVWTDVLRPTLSDRQGKAVFISTPQGFNWFYDMWNFAKNAEDWNSFQYTTVEGGNVLASEVEAAKLDLPLKTFLTEYEARFENSGHIIYYSFNMEDNVKSFTEETPREILIGLDFNVNPMSAVVARRNKEGLHIFDEIVLPNSHTEEMCQEIRNRYPNNQIVVFPDPAGRARKSSSSRTDHAILEQWGFTVKTRRSHTSVKDRINAVNRMWCDASGQRTMYVDPMCKETISCTTKHQYKEGTTVPSKGETGVDYSHQNDALGYLVDYLYPIKRPQPEDTGPARWGHF